MKQQFVSLCVGTYLINGWHHLAKQLRCALVVGHSLRQSTCHLYEMTCTDLTYMISAYSAQTDDRKQVQCNQRTATEFTSIERLPFAVLFPGIRRLPE